ncbi:hypothetical protein ACVWW4_008430 [Bradyrhizobium sp. LB7.1]
MRIDQPRHQHAAAAVDHLTGGCDVGSRYLLDLPVPDQNIGRNRERRVLSVENPDVTEQDGSVLLGRRRRRIAEKHCKQHREPAPHFQSRHDLPLQNPTARW